MSFSRLGVLLILFVVVFSTAWSAQNPRVVLDTNYGNITIELYPDDAPITVDNFLDYVNNDFYNGLVFHRVIEYFMIQGGGFYYNLSDSKFYKPATSAPIINESDNGLSNLRGTIAMARLGEDEFGNPQPDTATSQFFINHLDNPFLDRDYPDGDGYGYCVFGAVVEGMDVVDGINHLQTMQYYQADPPPPIYFEDLPQNYVGMNQPYVLPCDTSYCGNLAAGSRIGFEDFAIFASHWLDSDCDSAGGFCEGSDLDYSGGVDIADLILFLEHWTRTAGYEPEFSDLVVDNSIDLGDLNALMAHWLDSGCNEANDYCGGADIDHSGSVDFTDYSLFSNNWLATITP
ncbi:MAG: peptidylprolyl isomerase [Planctomycetes bacterium]|nr:peptidylprolyl isomerase [Planctomycetota bacterium]